MKLAKSFTKPILNKNMLIPMLTAYEKEHVSERQPLPERYLGLSDEEMDARIAAAKARLGRRVVILGHHYQRDEVIKFADYTGDSFKLARQVSRHPDAEFILFCGAGWRSALATKTLQDMGMTNVAHMDGGYTEWVKQGGPTETLEDREKRKAGKG